MVEGTRRTTLLEYVEWEATGRELSLRRFGHLLPPEEKRRVLDAIRRSRQLVEKDPSEDALQDLLGELRRLSAHFSP